MGTKGYILSLGLTKGDRTLKRPYTSWQRLAGLYFKENTLSVPANKITFDYNVL